jgi:RNA recognition motif-containing protein
MEKKHVMGGHRMRKISLASFLQDESPHQESGGGGANGTGNNGRGHIVADYSMTHLTTESVQSMTGEYGPSRSLWIGNLDPNLSEDEIRECFEKYGDVESLRLLPEKECAFVNYEHIEDAMAAKENMQGTPLGNTILRVRFGKVETVSSSSSVLLDSQPTCALWIGNVSGELDQDYVSQQLYQLFSPFGEIVFLRVLRQKNCAFINFRSEEEATNAKKSLSGRLLGKLPIKIGFAKPLATRHESESGISIGSTESDRLISGTGTIDGLETTLATNAYRRDSDEWSEAIPNLMTPRASIMTTPMELAHSLQQSLYIDTKSTSLQRKNEPTRTDSWYPKNTSRASAYEARTWTLSELDHGDGLHESELPSSNGVGWTLSAPQDTEACGGLVTGLGTATTGVEDDGSLTPSLEHLSFGTTLLGGVHQDAEDTAAMEFAHEIPELPELKPLPNPQRFKEIRRKLDGHFVQRDIDAALNEFFGFLIEMVTDSVGNLVFQKIIEKCSDQQRLRIIQILAPWLASISTHKNGTWAVQKIVEYANSTMQIQLVIAALRPYTVRLMQDRFGNYVIQSCLRLGPKIQFVIEAMTLNCLEIALNKFGCRAMKACLESHHVTRSHQLSVALSIVRHSPSLIQDPNGVHVVHWLLDSHLEGSIAALGSALRMHFFQLSMNKYASSILLRLIEDPLVRDEIMLELFEERTLPLLLQDTSAIPVIHRVFLTSHDEDEKSILANLLRQPLRILSRSSHHYNPYFKRLLDDVISVPTGTIPKEVGDGSVREFLRWKQRPTFSKSSSSSSTSLAIIGNDNSTLPIHSSTVGVLSGHSLSQDPTSMRPPFSSLDINNTTTAALASSTASLLDTNTPFYSTQQTTAAKSSSYTLLDPLYPSSTMQEFLTLTGRTSASSHLTPYSRTELSTNTYPSIFQETSRFSSSLFGSGSGQEISIGSKSSLAEQQYSSQKECPVCRTRFFKMPQAEFDLHVDDCTSKASLVNIDNFT